MFVYAELSSHWVSPTTCVLSSHYQHYINKPHKIMQSIYHPKLISPQPHANTINQYNTQYNRISQCADPVQHQKDVNASPFISRQPLQAHLNHHHRHHTPRQSVPRQSPHPIPNHPQEAAASIPQHEKKNYVLSLESIPTSTKTIILCLAY